MRRKTSVGRIGTTAGLWALHDAKELTLVVDDRATELRRRYVGIVEEIIGEAIHESFGRGYGDGMSLRLLYGIGNYPCLAAVGDGFRSKRSGCGFALDAEFAEVVDVVGSKKRFYDVFVALAVDNHSAIGIDERMPHREGFTIGGEYAVGGGDDVALLEGG